MESQPKPKGYLNFTWIQPLIDIEFWLNFTTKKLDDWKLEAPGADILATVSMPMSQKVSADLVIGGQSFDNDGFQQNQSLSKGSGGLLEFTVLGKFLHFNTIEEYQHFDVNTWWTTNRATHEQYFSASGNYFILSCFGDFKQYDFHYKVHLLQKGGQIETIKGKKLVK